MKTETIVTGHALEHKVHKREHSIGSRNLFPGYRIAVSCISRRVRAIYCNLSRSFSLFLAYHRAHTTRALTSLDRLLAPWCNVSQRPGSVLRDGARKLIKLVSMPKEHTAIHPPYPCNARRFITNSMVNGILYSKYVVSRARWGIKRVSVWSLWTGNCTGWFGVTSFFEDDELYRLFRCVLEFRDSIDVHSRLFK